MPPTGDPIQVRVEISTSTAPGNFDPMTTLNQFKERLEKKLAKKGRPVVWMQGPSPISIGLFLTSGNQLLRYLVPFLSPAVVEARGSWQTAPGRTQPLITRGAAHFGLLGGSAQGMLKTAAYRAADRMAKQLLKVPQSGFEPLIGK